MRNDHGQQVEEFEIQFVDGNRIDCELFSALGINQSNIAAFFEVAEEWTESDKVKAIIAAREVGVRFDLTSDDINDLDLDIYDCETYIDLAHKFVDEGLYGEIPDALRFYVDYDAIAYDLSFDYGDTAVAGANYIYRSI